MGYIKSNTPVKVGEDFVYLPTTADQVILSDGTRLEQGGKLPWKLMPVEFTVSFLTGDWSSEAPYVQTISVDSIRVSDKLTADVDLTDANKDTFSNIMASYSCINRISFGDGVLTAYCYQNVPTLDVKIRLWGVREV